MQQIANGFTWENALFFAEASDLAYQSEGVIRKRYEGEPRPTNEPGKHGGLKPYNVSGTQAFLLSTNAFILVAFRGTEPSELSDWFTDLKAVRVKTPMGRIHSGFKGALDLVWDQISEDLRIRSAPERPVYFTGHSLGGALAVLAASRRLQENMPVAGVYTFGQPKVGCGTFCKAYNDRLQANTFRIINTGDGISTMPMFPFYRHVRSTKFLRENGGFADTLTLHELNRDSAQHLAMMWRRLIRRIKTFFSDEHIPLPAPPGIDNHLMKIYLERIRKIRDTETAPSPVK